MAGFDNPANNFYNVLGAGQNSKRSHLFMRPAPLAPGWHVRFVPRAVRLGSNAGGNACAGKAFVADCADNDWAASA